MIDLAGIVEDSIVDGPGIRCTVFSQGCPHHCPGCHNPETWDFGCGTPMDEERIFEIVRSNPLCRGVTFSGGEPFAQAEAFARLNHLMDAAAKEAADMADAQYAALKEELTKLGGLYGTQKEAIEEYCHYAKVPLL